MIRKLRKLSGKWESPRGDEALIFYMEQIRKNNFFVERKCYINKFLKTYFPPIAHKGYTNGLMQDGDISIQCDGLV